MLHGEIKLNDQLIGEWTAVRKKRFYPHEHDDEGGPYHRYDCTIEYRDMQGYLMRANFPVWHRFGDGAMRLASRVIAIGYDKAKRVRDYE